VPGTFQYLSIIILPDKRKTNEGRIIAIKGIDIFLKTYLKKICFWLKPFVLAIKT
jgi:hypothetical protein